MKKVYAADFGAGNTCLFYANPDAKIQEALALNNPGGEPSGYALKKNGDVLLGLGLYTLTYDQLTEIDSFHVNIKARPDKENRYEMINYFRAWREKMEKEHSEEFKDVDEPYWFIGCPTGEEWKHKGTLDLYKSIFEDAGFKNVFVVPESNAAFAYYQKMNQIKSNSKDGRKYLLFDQGAYSLDATYFHNGTVSSYGGYLGASLIERMMIHVILEQDEETIRIGKKMINLKETVQGARDLLEAEEWKGKFYTYLLLKARRLKETYFTELSKGTLIKTVDTTQILDFTVDTDNLVLFINPVIMENILYKYPIKNVLGAEFDTLAPEVKKNIENKTWMQAFEDFLNEVNKAYPDINDGENVVIMLTGGGSLMSCIKDAIKSRYKKATVHGDGEAISAIGKGMTYWAPDKIKSHKFEMAFAQFIDKEEVDEEGDTVNRVMQYLSKAYAECVIPSIQAVLKEESDAVADGIIQWRDYHCENNEIPAKIESHLRKWSSDTGILSFKADIEKKINELKVNLNNDFYSVLDTFSIPRECILKEEDRVFLSDTSKIIPILFGEIVDSIVDHYKKNKIWSSFPNKRKGFFSDPRADFCNANAKDLTEWIDKETDGTLDLCKNVFGNMEFEISDGVKWTLNKLFVFEGYTDLCNLMKAHKNEILGQLVLEECIDDEDE